VKRRAQVIALFMAAAPISAMLGSPLAAAILSTNGAFGLKGWQLMFMLDAIAAILLGIFTFFYLNDSPKKNNWLSQDQTSWLISTLEKESSNKDQTAKTSIWKGLSDVRVLTLAIVYFGTSAGLYSLNIWSPQFLKSFGLTTLQTGFINAVPAALSIVAMISWAKHSDKTHERIWHVVLACLLACVGFLIAGLAHSLSLALVALIIASVGISSCKPPLWSIPSLFLKGPAAAAGLAAINSIGNLGGFAGPAIIGWIKENTGSFSLAMYCVAGMLLISAILTLSIQINKKNQSLKKSLA